MNYLIGAIEMLFILRRNERAEQYRDWIMKMYRPEGDEWKLPMDEFVFHQLTEAGTPIPRRARNQLTASLQMAMYFLAIGDERKYRRSVDYAGRVYKVFQESVPKRIKLRSLADYAAREFEKMLLAPHAVGFDLSFDARIRLYTLIGGHWPSKDADRPGPLLISYDVVARYLRRECDARDIDFKRTFPPPPYLDEYRRKRAARL